MRLVHRGVHRVDQLGQAAVDVGDGRGRPLEHRIAEQPDRVSRHRVIVLNRRSRPPARRSDPRRVDGGAHAADGTGRGVRDCERVGELVGVGRDHQGLSVGRTEHPDRRRRPRARRPSRAAPARRPTARRPRRTAGSRSRAGALGLGVGHERRAAGHERAHDLVVGLPRLHDQPGLVARPAREQLRAARREPVRLRRGAEPRARAAPGRDRGTRPASGGGGAARAGATPLRYRSRCRPSPTSAVAASTSTHPPLREQRRQLLSHARHSRRAARAGASHRTRRTPSAARRNGPSAAARGTRRTRAARNRPRRLSTQTATPADSRSALGQRLGEQPRAGRLLPAVDDQRAGPAARFDVGRRGVDRHAGDRERFDGGRGRDDRERRGRPLGALEQHLARVPRGRPLLLQRLVGVVDDDRGREIGHRRQRGGPPADDHAVPPRRAPPRCRCAPRRVRRSAGTRPSRPSERRYCASDRPRDGSATATIVDPSAGHIDATVSRRSASGGVPHHPPHRPDLRH